MVNKTPSIDVLKYTDRKLYSILQKGVEIVFR